MIHRRDAMLRLGQFGMGGLTLPSLLRAESTGSLERKAGKAKSCILVYLWGGPPQQDLWDMKPEAPSGIKSEFQPIDTVVPGIQICDQMPLLAKHTDKLAVVRSLSHDSNAHEPSVYYTLTGKKNPSLVVPRNQRTRFDFPNAGGVVSHFTPPGRIPAHVTIPRPIGHDGVTYAGTSAGFLGPRHDPLEFQPAAEVGAKATHDLGLPDGLDTTRLIARRSLLGMIEDHERFLNQATAQTGLDVFRDQAFRMLADPTAKEAFRLDRESPQVRDRYGRNEYGDCFLLARRLVEAGVRLITIAWVYICPNGNVANVWDNHGGTGSLGGITGFAMLKEKYCIPPLDLGLSALLEDLSVRGLLDETLVAVYGEFGRTPKINQHAGREHWGACQSALLAGGGIRGGQIHGSSDKYAAYPASDPVAPEDMLATIYHAMGIAPDSLIHDREGRPLAVSDGKPILSLFG
ncbi:MAG: DUF1501 domain-containing protein [Planctomycetota bacterium]